jgi:hypothetical protein
MPYDPNQDLAQSVQRDPLATAFGKRSPEPLYSESLYNGTGQLTTAQLAAMAPPDLSPQSFVNRQASGYDPDEDLGLSEAPGKLESFGRGALQGQTFGFYDELTGLVESAITDKSYRQGRDESRAANRRAKDENPWSYGIGEVGGGVGGAALTGGAGLAAKAGLTGVKAAAALGAAEGALAGVGSAEGGIDDSIKSALIGGVTGGALAGAAGKIFGKYASGAERRAVRDTTRELSEGALPTQSRRFSDIGELGFEVLEPDKAFMRAAKSRPEKAAEIAKDRLGDLAPQTKPIYQKLNKEVGWVPISHWENHFNDQIDRVRRNFGADDKIADALEEARDGFLAKARAEYGKNVKEIPHEDLRAYVTGLYKHKFRKLGTIAETENAELAAEAFDKANSFLKGRLDMYKVAKPELASDIENLSNLNRQIKAWAAAESLMDHKTTREFWKRGGLEAIANGKMGQLAGVGAVAGAVATGSPFGAAIGLVPKAISSAASGVKAIDRKATAALAKLSKAAREGDLTRAKYLEAIQQGVSLSTAAGIVGSMKQIPRWFKDEEEDGAGE